MTYTPEKRPFRTAADAEARPGRCPYCDEPKAPRQKGRKQTVTCGADECRRALRNDYCKDYRIRKGIKREMAVAILALSRANRALTQSRTPLER